MIFPLCNLSSGGHQGSRSLSISSPVYTGMGPFPENKPLLCLLYAPVCVLLACGVRMQIDPFSPVRMALSAKEVNLQFQCFTCRILWSELHGGWIFVPNYQKRKLNISDLKASVLLILEVSTSKQISGSRLFQYGKKKTDDC